MKNKKIIVFAMIGLFSVVGLSQTVNAATSEATVNFVPAGENADAPTVLDPSTPEIPYVPESESSDPTDVTTGETGPLTLDFVSNIEFSEQEVSEKAQIYKTVTLRPFIQVTDRRGSGKGWKVTARVGSFTTEGDASVDSLKGSVITLLNGDVNSNNTVTPPSEIKNPVVLETEASISSDIVEASEGEGMGSWITHWFPKANEEDDAKNSNVTLTVPGGVATTGTHTAEITWTLEVTP